MKGVSAVIATILMLVITIALAGVAFTFFQNSLTQATTVLNLVDHYSISAGASCNIVFVVKNGGANPISISSLVLSPINEDCATDPLLGSGNLDGGGTLALNATGCSTGRYHSYRLRGPSNALELTQICT